MVRLPRKQTLGVEINKHSSVTSSVSKVEDETRALRVVASGLARRDGSRTQVRHFEAASQLLARMRRLDPELVERLIRLAAEADALREAVGVSRLRLFLSVEGEYLPTTPVGEPSEAQHPDPDAFYARLRRILTQLRPQIKADPRIMAAF